MTPGNRVTPRKAYRRGHWQVVWWPIIFILLALGGLIWAVIAVLITVPILLIAFGSMLLIWLVWSLRRIAVWKHWMVRNSANPKTTLELAKTSFLKRKWSETMTIWTSKSRDEYNHLFEERMDEVRKEYLDSAAKKYAEGNTISVHYNFGSLPFMLMFEAIVITGLILLYKYLDDATMKIIMVVLATVSFGGFLYTLRMLWSRNRTVLEISKHGIKIEDKYYGWLELAEVDIVRGNTLIYRKHRDIEKSYDVSRLSLTGEYLDELILFYRTREKEQPKALEEGQPKELSDNNQESPEEDTSTEKE